MFSDLISATTELRQAIRQAFDADMRRLGFRTSAEKPIMTMQQIIDAYGESAINEICEMPPGQQQMVKDISIFGRRAPEILDTLHACGYRRPCAKNAPNL